MGLLHWFRRWFDTDYQLREIDRRLTEARAKGLPADHLEKQAAALRREYEAGKR